MPCSRVRGGFEALSLYTCALFAWTFRTGLQLVSRSFSRHTAYSSNLKPPAIHRQQRLHWDEFLAENTNIWKATRYLKPDQGPGWSRIPPLQRADGTLTTSNTEQAEQLLATFFPALPSYIEDEGDRPQRQSVAMRELTVEEIECCLMKTKPWKAASEDGLPAGVWRQLLPAVRESVRHLFQTSLNTGTLPQ